jgi:transcriptional regulator with XRE-family HTH domain
MTDRPKLTSADELRRRRLPNRERVDAIKRGVELDVALHELRERRGITQEQVAAQLETSRPNVSRIEREVDVRMSTLQRYVEALGGELELVARFPDGDSQTLLGGTTKVTGRRRARRSATEPS